MLRDTVVAGCQVKQPDRSVQVTRQSFATTANGLGELAAWLSDAGVDTVAMEATGVHGNRSTTASKGCSTSCGSVRHST